jgi:hypothetical protein
MMRWSGVPVVVVVFASLALAPAAYAESTAELLGSCKTVADGKVEGDKIWFREDYATGTCWGTFATFQRAINTLDDKRLRFFRVCAPATSTRHQLIAIFVEYARRNPQRLHEDFYPVVLSALVDAFPCSPNQ